MPRLYTRPHSAFLWCQYSHRGKVYRESTQETDPAKAKAYLKHRIQEVGADALGLRKFAGPANEKVLVSELLDALASDFRLRGIRSLKQSLSHLERARVHFGHYRAVEITPALVDCWYEANAALVSGADTPSTHGGRAPFSLARAMRGECGEVRRKCGEITKGENNDGKGNTEFDRHGAAGDQPGYDPVGGSHGDRPAIGDAERSATKARPYMDYRTATLNRTVSMLSQALSLAHRHGQVAQPPILRQLSELGNARQGFFEADQFARVCQYLPDYLRDFAQFAYLTGWRKGEIASLTWADVDLAGRVIRLRPEHSKNAQGRVLALEGELWELIGRRKAEQVTKASATGQSLQNASVRSDAEGGRAIFALHVFHRSGKPIGDFRKAWSKASGVAGVPGALFHDLRRTAARNMRSAGVPETVIMATTCDTFNFPQICDC